MKNMKKIISIALTFVLVATALILVPTSASAALPPDRTYVIMDTNKWDEFYCYVWQYGEPTVEWPGTKLEPVVVTDEFNLYEITLDPGFDDYNMIANNGYGQQSVDVFLTPYDKGFAITNEQVTQFDGRDGYTVYMLSSDEMPFGPEFIKSIRIAEYPEKDTYYLGEKFDPTGLEVRLNYYGGASSSTEKYTVAPVDTSKTGYQKIQISYEAETGKTFTTSFWINVLPRPVGVEVTSMPEHYGCIVGGKLRTSDDLVVNALCEDGSKDRIFELETPKEPPAIALRCDWQDVCAATFDKDGSFSVIQPKETYQNDFGEMVYIFEFPVTAEWTFFTNENFTVRTTDLYVPMLHYAGFDFYVTLKTNQNEEYRLADCFTGADPGKYLPDGYTLSPLEERAGRQTVTLTYRDFTTTFDVDVCDKGDVNRDFTLNVVDVTAIQSAIAELAELDDFQQQLADLNGDGNYDVTDATMLQMTIAGLS